MHPKIESIVVQSRSLQELWVNFYKQWQVSGLPVDVPYSRLLDSTMAEFGSRLLGGLELVTALEKNEEDVALLILHRLPPVTQSLQSAHASLSNLLKQLASREDKVFKLADNSLAHIQVFSNGSHSENIQVGGDFDNICSASNAVIDFAFVGLKTRKVRSLGQFTELANSLIQAVAEADVRSKSVNAAMAEATAALEEIKRLREQVQEHLSEADKAAEQAESAKDSVISCQNEAEAKLAKLREVAHDAGALESQVQAYSSNFEGFRKSLDDRVAQHDAFQQSAEMALKKHAEQEAEINRLLAKSEDMIKGATTAGLGASLEETRKGYETKMNGAKTGFKWSIALMCVSAAPLLMHLFPGLFGAWIGAKSSISPGEVFNSGAAMELLGKMFLLFPATWLTQFFSKSYSEFFHLEREYAHKSALARAVEGFKKEAPKYEEEITTAVFLEVQANPSKQMSPDAAEHPVLGPLLRKFLQALPLPGKDKTKPE